MCIFLRARPRISVGFRETGAHFCCLAGNALEEVGKKRMIHIFYNGTFSPSEVRARYLKMAGLEKGAAVLSETDARVLGNEFLRFYGRILDLALTYTEGRVPAGVLNGALAFRLAGLFGEVGQAIFEERMTDALDALEEMSEAVNAWLDDELKNRGDIGQTLYNAAQLAVNLALLYEPFLPRTSALLRRRLGFGESWQFSSIPSGASFVPREE